MSTAPKPCEIQSSDKSEHSKGEFSRRRFLATTTASTVGWATASRAAATSSGTIRVGVIGAGVRGKYLIGNLPQSARVTAICDCARSRMAGTLEPKGGFASVLQSFHNNDAARCATYQDYRRSGGTP